MLLGQLAVLRNTGKKTMCLIRDLSQLTYMTVAKHIFQTLYSSKAILIDLLNFCKTFIIKSMILQCFLIDKKLSTPNSLRSILLRVLSTLWIITAVFPGLPSGAQVPLLDASSTSCISLAPCLSLWIVTD